MSFHRSTHSRSGSALISTMLVITVLTIIVVAFMQSMSIEKKTARSYSNRYKAELAATSGANEAISLLLASDKDCLVNAYVEDTATYNGATYTAPYLTTLKLASDADTVDETHFLCSSIDPSKSGKDFWRKPSVASSAAETETTDINAATPSFPEGFIGLANADESRRIVPVPWRVLLADPSKPQNNDRTSSSYNPIVGRYAYWVDDESAKVNVPTAGNVDSTNQHQHWAGRNPNEVAIHPILATQPESAGSDAANLVTQREQNSAIKDARPPFPPSTFRNLSAGLADNALWQSRRSFVTSWSEADERGPVGEIANTPGVRKINLNDFVDKAHDYKSADGRGKIAKNVVALGDYINLMLPQFGERAAASGLNADSRRRYCVQIAANIQDYIDADSQPTVIRQNLDSPQWEEPPDPNGVGEGAPTQPPAAFGKENVPGVTEYVGYYYVESGALRIDHTFEVLNIYTKDITLDPSSWGTVHVFLAQRDSITPAANSNAPTPSLADPLVLTIPSNTTFPAGRYSLLTTLPPGSTYRSQWTASGSKWLPLNWITLPRVEGTFALGNNGLRMDGDQFATAADADTEIVLANDYGYLDIQPRVAQQGPVTFKDAQRLIASQPFGNDGSSAGNNGFRKYPLDSGDPRASTDIFPNYSESSGAVSSIAWRRGPVNSLGATVLGGDSNGGTYGFIPDNSGSDVGSYVPEPLFGIGTGNTRATSVIRDGNMATIGELGLIYDPALPSSLLTNGTTNRGGFRTLSIGTRYGEIEKAESTTNSYLPQVENDTHSAHTRKRAFHLMDIFDVSKERRGRVLLNSVLRDPRNIPLRSVFYNLKTQKNTASDVSEAQYSEYAGPADPNLTAETPIKLDAVINALTASAQPDKVGPFLALGQLGDMDIFNTGPELLGASLTPNAQNTTSYDRGREEILRNTFQLLTLKGTVYTVYVVAQAGDIVNSKFVPRATARLARTVKLERQYPADSLDVITPTSLQTNNTPLPDQTKVEEISTELF
jgi:hypothetical protein